MIVVVAIVVVVVALALLASSVCRPTTERSVVCAIWLIASATLSIATTARTGSATR